MNLIIIFTLEQLEFEMKLHKFMKKLFFLLLIIITKCSTFGKGNKLDTVDKI